MIDASEKRKIEKLKIEQQKLQKEIDALESTPVIYGYARVSSKRQARDGNSLEAQEQELKKAGAEKIFKDVYTGTTTDRPELDKLLSIIKPGDTFIVTKLDRMARSVQQGISLCDSLLEKNIRVTILTLGTMDSSPTGRLIRNVMLCFAEFERDMIMQRTREGREIARLNPDYREGRKPKYNEKQIELAMSLLDNHTYKQVTELTGISKSTLIRAKRKRICENIATHK